ncbi:type IV pilus modification protein PilV [Microbulbifer sp. JMSA004]|uniref:type IV pilus modification protein PilV n=1 Tax=unclassified Microbulbifer TaxID=2619833 RepID=UPI0024AC8D4A|nr:type IV pilus modification protein PilV [Microbulbifer sp. VAAF005]WHI48803.1 type IV pilus modification protein PilV [Microbulbifer sp. VAAF005]
MLKQKGATLIEVLVSVLVLAVGLLGLAATQVMSLKNGNGAHHRYMAALAAQEIIERMRANPTGTIDGEYNGSVGGSDSGDGDSGDDGSSGDGSSGDSGSSSTPDCSSACSVSELAELDLYEWELILSSNLPAATGTIAHDSGEVTVTISWSEQHTGENYGELDGGLDDATFEMIVEL